MLIVPIQISDNQPHIILWTFVDKQYYKSFATKSKLVIFAQWNKIQRCLANNTLHNKKGTSKNTLVFFTLRITFLFNNLSF